jgi:acetyl esterase/lipase
MTPVDAALERQLQLFESLRAQAPPPRAREDVPGVVSYYDLTYAMVQGFRPLVLDLHLPAKETARAVLLWVHGGAWMGGSRVMGQAIKMVQHGYAVAAVQYRLSGEAVFPAQLHDLKGAMRWLRANAHRFGYNAERIVGWGASAGAHLACMLALTAGQPEYEGDVGGNLEHSSALQGVIDYFGVTDFFAMTSRTAPDPVTGLLGYAKEERPEEARQAMPITYVRADAPPFLIVHGDIDPLVPHAQSDALHQALRAAGASSTLNTLPGALHEDVAFWSEDTLGRVRLFLETI